MLSRINRNGVARCAARAALLLAGLLCGCSTNEPIEPVVRPVVSPAHIQPLPELMLELDASQISPMFAELVDIDLHRVVRLALAANLDVLEAREQVEATRGQYQSTVGSAFPVIVPTALFEHVEGQVRATPGNMIGVGFNSFAPSIAVQWVINPGKVAYEIIAAKKRLVASEQREEAILIDALRRSVVQYYELILAQAEVAAENQAVTEAEELLRITSVRASAGSGVRADELRAEARLAERRQELAKAMNRFYNMSITLSLTLNLDAVITLIPRSQSISPLELVRTDLDVAELLAVALEFRPDLESTRTLADAVGADRAATWWGAWGMNFALGYKYGGIMGHANNVEPGLGIPSNLIVNPGSPDGSFSGNPLVNGLIKEGILRTSRRLDSRSDASFGLKDQQVFHAATGWRLSLSAIGDVKTASAAENLAVIEAERQFQQVRAQVSRAIQDSRTNFELISLANQEVEAAREALRLTEVNLRAGTMQTLDVLQAQDAVAQARLSFAEAVVRYNQSEVNLLAALGLLNDETALTFAPTPEQPDEPNGGM